MIFLHLCRFNKLSLWRSIFKKNKMMRICLWSYCGQSGRIGMQLNTRGKGAVWIWTSWFCLCFLYRISRVQDPFYKANSVSKLDLDCPFSGVLSPWVITNSSREFLAICPRKLKVSLMLRLQKSWHDVGRVSLCTRISYWCL